MLHLNKILALVTFAALSRFGVDAAECTDAQVARDNELLTWVDSQPVCAEYALSATSYKWPCSDIDCTAVMAGVIASMSDCDTSKKTSLQNAITICMEGYTNATSSPDTNSTSKSTPAPTIGDSNC